VKFENHTPEEAVAYLTEYARQNGVKNCLQNLLKERHKQEVRKILREVLTNESQFYYFLYSALMARVDYQTPRVLTPLGKPPSQ
jgi:hypothetical protein